MNTTRQETKYSDPSCLEQVIARDSRQNDFSREKTRTSKRIDTDKVEDLMTYKKRAEMLERSENSHFSSKGKDICTSSQKPIEDSARVPPNSPNNGEFEFDCWDYFSSIFFQLFHDAGKRHEVRPKSDGCCAERSLDMWKEFEWRASREQLRSEPTTINRVYNGDDKPFSQERKNTNYLDISSNEFEKHRSVDEQTTTSVNAADRHCEPKKSSGVRRQKNRYKLVLPEKPRYPFLHHKGALKQERLETAGSYKSMESAYEKIKNNYCKKTSNGAAKKQMLFTEENTCSVYFPENKQNKQTLPAQSLKCKANIISAKTVKRENSDIVKTEREPSEVKECLVTCAFRLNCKEDKTKNDSPKDIHKNKVKISRKKFTKPTGQYVDNIAGKNNDKTLSRQVASLPKRPENKMTKYRKNSKEQESLEKTQSLELKTRQFEFPVFAKSEMVLSHQVKRVSFAPLPVLTSKVTYEKKDYDAWSRNDDKKTVKPMEVVTLKWRD